MFKNFFVLQAIVIFVNVISSEVFVLLWTFLSALLLVEMIMNAPVLCWRVLNVSFNNISEILWQLLLFIENQSAHRKPLTHLFT